MGIAKDDWEKFKGDNVPRRNRRGYGAGGGDGMKRMIWTIVLVAVSLGLLFLGGCMATRK